MKKYTFLSLFAALLVVFIFVGVSCSTKNTNTNTADEEELIIDENNNEEEAIDPQDLIMPAADVVGIDVPGIERYPNSIRTASGSDSEEAYAEYKVKDTVENVQKFFKDQIEGKGYTYSTESDETISSFYKGGADYYESNDTIDVEFDLVGDILNYYVYHYTFDESDANINEE